MPYPFQLRPPRFSEILKSIRDAVYEPVGELSVEAWATEEPVGFEQRTSGRHIVLKTGDAWGKLFDCAWMRFQGAVPVGAAGNSVVALIDFNGEGYVADADGNPILGLTAMACQWDSDPGARGKRVVPIASQAKGGEKIDLWIDAGNNDLFGVLQNGGALREAIIAVCKPDMRSLGYDFEVLSNLMEKLPPRSARAQRIRAKLYEASLLLREHTNDEAAAARAVLAPELAKRGGDPSLKMTAIGHAHIDLAWLWPMRETFRKGARTFATVLAMMERYPDYVFGASQPQLYDWMKQQYPQLYARIKKCVKDGRWEPQGAMWIEPDTNIPGGESLIRQILYGRQFFRDEFGAASDYLWEPDVFGYTGSLPQILLKSGVRYFMTQKLSWNEINKFPHQTFWWEGIDGSRVLAHMLPEEQYGSDVRPSSILWAEENYFDSPVSDECLVLYGIGDGGGGPGEEHLERLARIKNLEGLCPVTQAHAGPMLKRLEANGAKYVTWRGELYLEKHQGTLTTQARNKRYNRKLEYLLRDLELSAVWALQANPTYVLPKAELDALWKEVLLYQFHDILPGSSITRVYDESLPAYARIELRLREILAEADAAWSSAVSGTVLVNALSWPRSEWVRVGGSWRNMIVPALGCAELGDLSDAHERALADAAGSLNAAENVLDNGILRVRFAASGAIESIYDSEACRQVLSEGCLGNHLALYDDDGDAWDFGIDYEERPPSHPALVSREVVSDGPTCVARCVYRTAGELSTITQDVVLTAGSRRIDFRTHVDWRESNKMLRALFPVDVFADKVTCDIQFGTIQRPTTNNTTWEAAVHEIAAHKWVDLSDAGYGVALLNDCKYGHRVKQGVISLNLLRSPSSPDPKADRAEHEFTYALYPHEGDAVAANVMRAGYELNIPIRVVQPAPESGAPAKTLPGEWVSVDAGSVVVETIKPAEDDPAAVVIRLYESSGARVRARVSFGMPVTGAELVSLIEEDPQPIAVSNGGIDLEFGPFEIHTIRLRT